MIWLAAVFGCAVVVEAAHVYTDARLLGVQGRAEFNGTAEAKLSEREMYYDRLPAEANGQVRDQIWQISRLTAGMYVQFKTCSPDLFTKVTYTNSYMSAWNFAATGLAGLDLYAWERSSSSWQWVGTTQNFTYPTSINHMAASRGNDATRYRLHLPLYNGVKELHIGHDASCPLEPDADEQERIIWYGTSIAQGASASRPGMAFTNAIGLRTPYHILNFGFSSNCLMETNVAQYLVQIPDPSLFVVDCLMNMDAESVRNKTVPLVNFLREYHPTVPIILVEDTLHGAAWLEAWPNLTQQLKREALRTSYEALVKAGDTNLHYVYREQLYNFTSPADKFTCTVDRIHPTDLGMQAIADFFTKLLPTILSDTATAVDTLQHGSMPLHDNIEVEEWNFDTYSGDERAGDSDPFHYTDVVELGVMGRGFTDAPTAFNRLPARARGAVRDFIWSSSLDSTGLFLAFETNATVISFNYGLTTDSSSPWQLPMTTSSGVDLFRFDEATGVWGWVNTLHSFPKKEKSAFGIFSSFLPEHEHPSQYMLFLPLLKEVAWGFVGVNKGASLPKRNAAFSSDGVTINGKRPILWYGTSESLVGGASLPGRILTNTLTRNLGRVVLNMGFTGNGSMEINEVDILSEIDAEILVIESSPALVTSNIATVVQLFRQRRAYTPIVLVEMHGFISSSSWDQHSSLKMEYEKLLEAGYKYLHLVQRSTHHGVYNPTVDGARPTDVGHWEMSVFFTQYLQKILRTITSTTMSSTSTSTSSMSSVNSTGTTATSTSIRSSSMISRSTTTVYTANTFKAYISSETVSHHQPTSTASTTQLELPRQRVPPRLPSSSQALSTTTKTFKDTNMHVAETPSTISNQTTIMTTRLTHRPPPPRLPRAPLPNEVTMTITTTVHIRDIVQKSMGYVPIQGPGVVPNLRQNSSNSSSNDDAAVILSFAKVLCQNSSISESIDCNQTLGQSTQPESKNSLEYIYEETEDKSQTLQGVVFAASFCIIFSLSW